MSKAKQTKAKIIQQAAELFNQQGYAGSSISDIMRVTGLQKGGIYNHFKSKDELALEAFDFAIACIRKPIKAAIKANHHAVDRLQAMIGVYRSLIDNPPIQGGCPILNTAIESDDTHPALRERAQQAMTSWRELIGQIINKGIEKGEIRPTINADEVSTILIATLEGGIMMSKLYGDAIYLERAINHLTEYIKNQLPLSS